jgi:ABC-2 type transport system ATP-binding protein
VIEFDDLKKRYLGHTAPALDGMTLTAGDAETVALVGPNGAGKTTAIRIAVGVLLPTAGEVRVDGHDVLYDKKRASSTIGWVSDSNVFDPRARAVSLLRYLSGFYPANKRLSSEDAQLRLEEVGLGAWAHRRIGTYSYGMRKRVALAAATVGDPNTFVLDEPFEGLDPEGQRFLRGWLDARAASGCAILLSTHRLPEVQRIAHRVVVLNLGKIVRILSRSEYADSRVTAVRVSGPKLDQAAAELLAAVGEVALDGPDLLVSGPSIDSSEIAQLLVTHGFRITQLKAEPKTLERVYDESLGTTS